MTDNVSNVWRRIRSKSAKLHTFSWATVYPTSVFFELDNFYALTSFDNKRANMHEDFSETSKITRRRKVLWVGEHADEMSGLMNLQSHRGTVIDFFLVYFVCMCSKKAL